MIVICSRMKGDQSYYQDLDLDGYGDPNIVVEACIRPQGTVENADDCDDTDGTLVSDPEVCDGVSTTRMDKWMRPVQLAQQCSILMMT